VLDVHRLRVFRSVVASGSIQAAAGSLGLTPSAVSQHVTALQRETGLSLVSRVGRGIEPTDAGRVLADRIDGVLGRLAEVESVARDLRAGRAGSLSISYFGSVGSAWMPRVARVLLRDFPDLRLSLTLREDLPADPAERADVQVIVERPDFEPPGRTRAYHLLEDPYVAVVPAGHRLAGEATVELAALRDERWVDNDIQQGWCRRNLIDACRAAGFAPVFAVETQDHVTALAFVAAGIGLSVLPRLGTRQLPPGVVAVPVTGPTPVRSIHALVQIAVENTPAVRATLRVLARCARQEDDA
jgi:DNA-binding transcriptional LysR family regulator